MGRNDPDEDGRRGSMRSRVLFIVGLSMYWILFRGSYFRAFFAANHAPSYMSMLFDCAILAGAAALFLAASKHPGILRKSLVLPFGAVTTVVLTGVCLLWGIPHAVALVLALVVESLWVCWVSGYWGLACLQRLEEESPRTVTAGIALSLVLSYLVDLPRLLLGSEANHLLYALYPLVTAVLIKMLPPVALDPEAKWNRTPVNPRQGALLLAVSLFLLISTLLVGTHIDATTTGYHRALRHGISAALALVVAACFCIPKKLPGLHMAPWWLALLASLAGSVLLVAPDTSLALIGADALTAGRRTIWVLCWILLLEVAPSKGMRPLVLFGVAYPALFALTRLPINTLRAVNPSQYMPENELYVATLVVSLTLTGLALFIAGNTPSIDKGEESPRLHLSLSDESSRRNVCQTIARRFGLSEREEITLEQLSMGYTLKKISEAQCVSENTVKTHTKAIYRKIGCHSKQELIDVVEQLMGEKEAG